METKTGTLYQREGMAQGAVGAVISLIVGVGVSVLIMIFVGALGGQTYNLTEDNIDAIGNNSLDSAYSFTASNSTAVYIGHTDIHSSSLRIYNSTANVTSEFTLSPAAGTVTTANDSLNAQTFNANYTWGDPEVRTAVKGGITSSFSALEQTGDYLPIIVLAVVISLVLALVLSFTQFGNMGSGRGSAL